MSPDRRLVVSIDEQTLKVYGGGVCLRTFEVSTAARGVGSQEGSYRTPCGRFRIGEKIGAGAELGTVFKAREPAGRWKAGDSAEGDMILSRIIRIEGLDEHNLNTFERYIYLHGTNDESNIGRPVSHGCVRLRNADVIELFEMVETGDLLEIIPPLRASGRLLFIACDFMWSGLACRRWLAWLRGLETLGWRLVVITVSGVDGRLSLPKSLEVEHVDCRADIERVVQEWLEALPAEKAAVLIERGAIEENLAGAKDVRLIALQDGNLMSKTEGGSTCFSRHDLVGIGGGLREL